MLLSKDIGCKVQAYNLNVRIKGFRTVESPDMMFSILTQIKDLTYNSKVPNGEIRRKIGNFWFSMKFRRFDEKDDKFTRVDFTFDRETKENFQTKDLEGNDTIFNLPEDKNWCFKTQGSFLFTRYDKNGDSGWNCILLIERRFSTAGTAILLKYIEKVKGNISIDIEPITSEFNLIKRINSIRDLKSVIVKNQVLEFNEEDGWGKILKKDSEHTGHHIENMQIKLLEGDTSWAQIWSLLKGMTKEKEEIDEKKLKEIVDETEMVLVRSNGKRVPLFTNFKLYDLKIKSIPNLRTIDVEDFFTKLYLKANKTEIDKMFELSRQFNNRK